MSSPGYSKVGDLQSLLTRAAKTRVDCRTVCGSKARTVYSATNLYGVLKRLQQEATVARSSLNTSTSTCNEGLAALYTESTVLLTETSDFLLAYKTIGHYEDKILGSWDFSSFTETQWSIIDHFDSEIMRLTYTAVRFLIMVSADALAELREQLDYGTGSPLSPILNDLTARLMANGDLRLSMLMKGPENERILWEALQHELLGMSLDKVFLHRHKKVVLRYVRALERRSGFAGSSEAPLDDAAETMKTAQNSSAKRRSLCNEDDAGGKRARTSGERSEDPRLFDTPETAHSKTRNGGIPFRFRDPRITFGPDVDDDRLADFIEEEEQPSLGHTLRNQMRNTYRTLFEDYEPSMK
ncbi:MAG: hypothetical protein L6R38_006547, partial [Xanthoria sp. 2 TBL-2021]